MFHYHSWRVRIKNPNISHSASEALLAAAREHTGVPGFRFPIRSEREIERLEAAVRNEAYKWENYTAFLRDLKVNDPNTPIRCIFQSVFYDEALVNYNYNGISNTPGVKKRAMKGYAIFRDCFLAAWLQFGVTDDMIRGMLTEIIKNINRRRRNRQYKNRIQRKKLQNSFAL
ncbi:AAEL004610-PA [Aedes aegypti]|uniref:AAEL004610-PA n=1 Tax=Aedes aegypti TaxID=7159 RepID=Q17CC8_AEDAE|nr:AAEL004610-PA [Aedes aegypti]